MLECVVNVSEGNRREVIERLAKGAGASLIDLHSDRLHNRTVLTLAGPLVKDSVRIIAERAVAEIDIGSHGGAHPRMGAIDVVPFVPLAAASDGDALRARDDFATWAGSHLGVPCFRYGPELSLPEVRRRAFAGLSPDTGPDRPHPTAGACAVGARPPLVAYNLWLEGGDRRAAAGIASALRGPDVRALALDLGGSVQLSFNLVAPNRLGPADVYDAVSARAQVARAELVGLVPQEVLARIPESRWASLGLDPSATIEARLAAAGLAG